MEVTNTTRRYIIGIEILMSSVIQEEWKEFANGPMTQPSDRVKESSSCIRAMYMNEMGSTRLGLHASSLR